MAGSRNHPNQQRIPFEGADQDASVEFRQKMTMLREKLKSVAPEAAGLSGLRWEQVRELIMAITSYKLRGRQPPFEDVIKTSTLTRDQAYVARKNAERLGLMIAKRRYIAGVRGADELAVDELAVDELAVDELARGPTNAELHRMAPNKSELHRTTPNSTARFTNPRTRAGAAKELPINSSSSSTRVRAKRRLQKAIEEVEEAVKKIGVECRGIQAAVSQAIRDGKATRQELLERVAWFGQQLEHYAPEHRGGALKRGLEIARRGMPVREGWPYSENFLEQEARRDRERERRRIDVAQQWAGRRNANERFERYRKLKQQFGPQLDALSDEDLRALELECFHNLEAANFARGTETGREILITALANKIEKGTTT
jgi:hypothetical protein